MNSAPLTVMYLGKSTSICAFPATRKRHDACGSVRQLSACPAATAGSFLVARSAPIRADGLYRKSTPRCRRPWSTAGQSLADRRLKFYEVSWLQADQSDCPPPVDLNYIAFPRPWKRRWNSRPRCRSKVKDDAACWPRGQLKRKTNWLPSLKE
jgi:hypothetical protein